MEYPTGDLIAWPHSSPVLDAIGGFQRLADDPLTIVFDVDDRKVNARGLLHAGVIATIADVAIGHALAAMTNPPTRLVTVNLSCDLIGTARHGDRVIGVVSPTRLGQRLAAGTAAFQAGRTIATVSALFVPEAPARQDERAGQLAATE